MNTLPEIALKKGNIFKVTKYSQIWSGRRAMSRMKDEQVVEIVRKRFKTFSDVYTGVRPDGEIVDFNIKDAELVGITPKFLAELAIEKGEKIEIALFKEWTRIFAHAANGVFKPAKQYILEEGKESLEEFCLRVARKRKYI